MRAVVVVRPVLSAALFAALVTLSLPGGAGAEERGQIRRASPAITPIKLSPAERAWIRDHPKIRVHFEAWPPFQILEDGRTGGITNDYIETICGSLGIEVQYVHKSWSEALVDVQQPRHIDVLPVLTRNREREAYLGFTRVYVSFPIVIFARQGSRFIGDLDDLHDDTIAVERDYSMHGRLLAKVPDSTLLVVDRTSDALEAVVTGQADAYVGNLAVGSYIIQQQGLTSLKIAAPSSLGTHDQAMGVRQDWPILAELLDRGLEAITPEGHRRIRQRWLAVRYEHGLRQADIWRWVLIVVAAASVLLFIALAWNRRLSREIADRRRAEEEREQLEVKMRHVQRLEEIGVLAGGIAHDFNNILTTIISNAQLSLESMPGGSDSSGSINEVLKASKKAAGLCQQMLAYSGKGHFSLETLDLNSLVEELAGMLSVSISKKASLEVQLDPELKAIEGDASLLSQVVMNLITNASESLGDESGSITVSTSVRECPEETFATTLGHDELAAGSYVVLEVSDSGSGMDEETVERLFDPFFTTKFAGRGLGMAAVLGIVRSHHAAIRVESQLRKGTTFTLFFKALRRPARELRRRDSSARMLSQGSGRVLVVDDEPQVLRAVQRVLTARGFDVTIARNGREAVALFTEHVDELTCVVLDLTMPVMDGQEAFEHMREIDSSVPVVMVSGYHEVELERRFGEGARPAAFVKKPFDINDLTAVVVAATKEP